MNYKIFYKNCAASSNEKGEKVHHVKFWKISKKSWLSPKEKKWIVIEKKWEKNTVALFSRSVKVFFKIKSVKESVEIAKGTV